MNIDDLFVLYVSACCFTGFTPLCICYFQAVSWHLCWKLSCAGTRIKRLMKRYVVFQCYEFNMVVKLKTTSLMMKHFITGSN